MDLFSIVIAFLVVWVVISNFEVVIKVKGNRGIGLKNKKDDSTVQTDIQNVKKDQKPRKINKRPSLEDIEDSRSDEFSIKEPRNDLLKEKPKKIKIQSSFDRLDNA